MTTKPPVAPFPFAGNLLESFELMRNIWGAGFQQVPGFPTPAAMAQSLPSMMVPTLDINELDKRITDLRAVEQWLALNASMLRASIQTLEVQRNTIATLKTLSGTMMSKPLMTPAGSAAASAPTPAPSASAAAPKRARRPSQEAGPAVPNLAEMPLNPAAWWGTLQDQFTRIAAAAAGDTSAAGANESKESSKPAARKPPVKRSS
jgi:hypothetical protein